MLLVFATLVQLGISIITTKVKLSLDAGAHSRQHIRPKRLFGRLWRLCDFVK